MTALNHVLTNTRKEEAGKWVGSCPCGWEREEHLADHGGSDHACAMALVEAHRAHLKEIG